MSNFYFITQTFFDMIIDHFNNHRCIIKCFRRH